MRKETKLTPQGAMARYLLLGTVIITVIVLAELLKASDLYIPYYAAVPYMLVQFGMIMDGIGGGNMTTVGLILAGVILAGYLLIWFMAADRPGWLKAGLVLVIADTVLFVGVSLLMDMTLMDIVFELFLHGVVIYEIFAGVKAETKATSSQT